MRDRRTSLRLITDVVDVLRRHGFTRGDDEHVGRAGFLIGDLARIYEGSQDRPFGSSITQASYLPAPPGQPGPEDDLDAVTLTHAEVRTVLNSLDLAGDWKRDRAETCADCPDQTCFACQLRLPASPAGGPCLRPAGRPAPARRAGGPDRAPPGRATRPAEPARPRSRPGGRPVTTFGRAPEQPGPRRQADGPLIPDSRPGDRDMREMKDPYDLPFPGLSERWPAGHPKFVIVVDQLRDWQPGQPPSLAELLETRRTREPEPDLEAEP